QVPRRHRPGQYRDDQVEDSLNTRTVASRLRAYSTRRLVCCPCSVSCLLVACVLCLIRLARSSSSVVVRACCCDCTAICFTDDTSSAVASCVICIWRPACSASFEPSTTCEIAEFIVFTVSAVSTWMLF